MRAMARPSRGAGGLAGCIVVLLASILFCRPASAARDLPGNGQVSTSGARVPKNTPRNLKEDLLLVCGGVAGACALQMCSM